MSLLKSFTEEEKDLLRKHGLSDSEHSQLSDSFVIGLRYARAESEMQKIVLIGEENSHLLIDALSMEQLPSPLTKLHDLDLTRLKSKRELQKEEEDLALFRKGVKRAR